jgi:chromosome segregation ATPase
MLPLPPPAPLSVAKVRHHQERLAAATAGHSSDTRAHDEKLLIARHDAKRLEKKLDAAEAEIRKLQASATEQVREAARQEQIALHALSDQKTTTSRANEELGMVGVKIGAAESQIADLKSRLVEAESDRKSQLAAAKEKRNALVDRLTDKEAELSLQVSLCRCYNLVLAHPLTLCNCDTGASSSIGG